MRFIILLAFVVMLVIPIQSYSLEENGILKSYYSENPSTIDGMWTSPDEWTDASASRLEIANQTTVLLLKHDNDYLYVMFDVISDTVQHTEIEGASIFHTSYLMFDTEINGGSVLHSDDLRILYGKIFDYTQREINYVGNDLNKISTGNLSSSNPLGTFIEPPSDFKYELGFSSQNDPLESEFDHYIHEYQIPLDMIGNSETVGFAIMADTGVFSLGESDLTRLVWPANLDRSTIPDNYGNLKFVDAANTEAGTIEEPGGGCLIATAAYGSEMAPQVQFLREIRDGKVMTTGIGTAFMSSFNQFYYSFSPYVADYQRENPAFKEMVRIGITPLLASLEIMNNAETEQEILGYGIGVILLNVGMYFVAPAMMFVGIRKKL